MSSHAPKQPMDPKLQAHIDRIEKRDHRVEHIFRRILHLLERLIAVINNSRGLSNKELARFTDQINALCEKYLRK